MRSMLYPSRFWQLTQDYPDAWAALLCGVLLLLGWLFLELGWVGVALLMLPAAYVIGGYDSAREGFTTLLQEQELDVDLLMIVAALGAAGLGLWKQEYYLIVDGAVLILIFAISGALEGYAMRRTERSIRSLMSLTPDTARLLQNGQEQVIAIRQLQVGDQVLVKPGELIPIDGLIVEGYSTINQAAITGESLPIEKTVGDEVFAGTLNGTGALRLEVNQPPESNLIQRVIRLVEQAQTENPPSQQFIERFERGYARVIVLIGILLTIVPPFLWGWTWEVALYRALIFLVVASPCALMAAIMPTLLSGIANGARQGILFKNGAQLELIGNVRAIAFDKTGTLTTGQLEVSQIMAAPGYLESEILQIAAVLEAYSEHPIGQAICRHATNLKPPVQPLTATAVQARPGNGIVGMVQGQKTCVGNAKFALQAVESLPSELVAAGQQREQQGNTVVWISQGINVLGMIAIADTLRPEATATLSELKKLGVETIVLLTGDNERTARRVAQLLGIEHVYAELLPEDKLRVIRDLQQRYQTVAMVGDGINDAPALAQASVGIAMGAIGSDVALETADIVLVADRLEKLAVALRLGQRSQRVIQQNIAFALSLIVLLLVANFVGGITLPLGVIGHEGSTMLVTLSGLRLLK
jgi:Cd2+/Zn2+-exporting ATPase